MENIQPNKYKSNNDFQGFRHSNILMTVYHEILISFVSEMRNVIIIKILLSFNKLKNYVYNQRFQSMCVCYVFNAFSNQKIKLPFFTMTRRSVYEIQMNSYHATSWFGCFQCHVRAPTSKTYHFNGHFFKIILFNFMQMRKRSKFSENSHMKKCF